MTAFNRFKFPGYILRPAETADLPLAAVWTAKDDHHADRVDPVFWIKQGPGQDAYVLTDEDGAAGVLFFIKLVAAGRGRIELHIQFDPGVDGQARARRRDALLEGLTWLEATLRLVGISEIFFRSRNQGLILFAQKRLGFQPDPIVVEGESMLRKDVRLRPFVPGSEDA